MTTSPKIPAKNLKPKLVKPTKPTLKGVQKELTEANARLAEISRVTVERERAEAWQRKVDQAELHVKLKDKAIEVLEQRVRTLQDAHAKAIVDMRAATQSTTDAAWKQSEAYSSQAQKAAADANAARADVQRQAQEIARLNAMVKAQATAIKDLAESNVASVQTATRY